MCTSNAQRNTRNRITIPAAHTYIVKEDGGIAMAQLANLPSRLFHILFGQSPERWRNRRQKISPKTQNQSFIIINFSHTWMDVVCCVDGCSNYDYSHCGSMMRK